MAGLRLLHLTGNLSMARLGPGIDQALATCTEGAWCLLAHADYHLFAPAEVGALRVRAIDYAERAKADLPGPAAARLWMATGEDVQLQALSEHATDGLGTGFVHSAGKAPETPGAWFIGVGLLGAPGLGYGGAVRYTQPDLFRKAIRLHLEASGTHAGHGGAVLSLQTGGKRFGYTGATASRAVVGLYDLDSDQLADAIVVDSASGWVGLGARYRPHWTALRFIERVDVVGTTPMRAPTLEFSGGWEQQRGWGASRSGIAASGSVQRTFRGLGGDYPLSLAQGSVRGYLPIAGFVIAGRGHAEIANASAPFFRLPSAGGADILRGAPYGRYRGAKLGAVDLELRRMLTGPIEGVLFGAAAVVSNWGMHPTAGFGIRLLLPPTRTEGLRLDVGFSEEGWALATGWNEAF
jgi:hypothetical protein